MTKTIANLLLVTTISIVAFWMFMALQRPTPERPLCYEDMRGGTYHHQECPR